jgi:hypothetical protein
MVDRQVELVIIADMSDVRRGPSLFLTGVVSFSQTKD